MKIRQKILFFFLLVLSLTQNQNNNSIPCSFGFFTSTLGTCVQCLTTCSKCKSLLAPCASCSQGFKLNSNKTKCEQCKLGQNLCQQNKIVCSRFYKYENNQCKPICTVKNCKQCQSIFSTECNVCYDNFQISNDKKFCTYANSSVKLSLVGAAQNRNLQQTNNNNSNFSTNIPQNIFCLINQYKDLTNVCQQCNNKCSTCINSADQCLTCNQGYIKNGWKCIANQSLQYQLTLGIANTTYQTWIGNLPDSINEVKKKILQDILPSNYAKLPLSVLSLNSLLIDKDTNKIFINGSVDKVGSLNLTQINKTMFNNLKPQTKLGPFTLLSSQLLFSQSNQNRKYPIPQNNYTVINNDEEYKRKLAILLIISIVLGLSLLISLLFCLCYCCKCCCFKNNQIQTSQRIETDRKLMAVKSQTSLQQLNKPKSLKQIVNRVTPITPAISPIPTTNRMPTITSATSITISQGNQNNLRVVQDQNKLKKLVSMDSLDQQQIRNIHENRQKISISNKKDDLINLKESQIHGRQIRTVLPIFGTQLRTQQIEYNQPINTMSKYYVANGEVTQQIQQNKNIETTQRKTYTYRYINQQGQQINIKHLPAYLDNDQYLKKIGIRRVVDYQEFTSS